MTFGLRALAFGFLSSFVLGNSSFPESFVLRSSSFCIISSKTCRCAPGPAVTTRRNLHKPSWYVVFAFFAPLYVFGGHFPGDRLCDPYSLSDCWSPSRLCFRSSILYLRSSTLDL